MESATPMTHFAVNKPTDKMQHPVMSASGSPQPRVGSRLNPANAVTAARFVTLPPLLWAVHNGHHQWATLFVVICGVMDKLDGFVARMFDCRSSFGEMFDAITDAICWGFALVVVAAYGWAPVVPVVAILTLGIANTVMRGVYVKRAGRTVNYKSYAMERLVTYTVYLVAFATGGMAVAYFYWVFVPIMVAIVAHDTKRMVVDPIAPLAEAETAS
jgi:phosphatidylglycerophosphate synthase